MKLRKYGIFLERVTEADLEMIRQHRNSPEIRQYMNYREEITPEMQMEWFHSIDNYSNYYFIIRTGEKKIGLINIKNIRWEKGNSFSESGLFLWDFSFIDTQIPLLASLCLSEFGFGFLHGDSNFIHVLEENKKAMDYTRMLGFEEDGKDENGLIQLKQTKESFVKSSERLRSMALKTSDHDPHLYLYVEEIDWKTGLANDFFEHRSRFSFNYEMKDMGDYTLYAFDFGI
jgi:RimJ/RimL family protein N-acetyltransferase